MLLNFLGRVMHAEQGPKETFFSSNAGGKDFVRLFDSLLIPWNRFLMISSSRVGVGFGFDWDQPG